MEAKLLQMWLPGSRMTEQTSKTTSLRTRADVMWKHVEELLFLVISKWLLQLFQQRRDGRRGGLIKRDREKKKKTSFLCQCCISAFRCWACCSWPGPSRTEWLLAGLNSHSCWEGGEAQTRINRRRVERVLGGGKQLCNVTRRAETLEHEMKLEASDSTILPNWPMVGGGAGELGHIHRLTEVHQHWFQQLCVTITAVLTFASCVWWEKKAHEHVQSGGRDACAWEVPRNALARPLRSAGAALFRHLTAHRSLSGIVLQLNYQPAPDMKTGLRPSTVTRGQKSYS